MLQPRPTAHLLCSSQILSNLDISDSQGPPSDRRPVIWHSRSPATLLKQQASSSSSMAAPLTSTGSRPPPPTYRPPKQSFARRYKFLWPMLLTVNFSMGAYILLMPKKEDEVTGKVESSQVPSESAVAANACTSPAAENK
nr:protein STU1 [Ipomoea batatas]GMC49996.1 protein STU1 [Ipomoea batatas]